MVAEGADSMALPDFTASVGLALVRKDPDDEWHFVCWVIDATAVALEVLTPGTHRYELWEIIGSGQTDFTSVSYAGPIRLGVIQMHK